MPKVALYNTSGASVGEIELSDAIFGQEGMDESSQMTFF